ncbi:MAG: polysaccharide pyruvyl transferase family protein [Campylobacter sp.]|nr:polysaccharide pyruvyl transferase family protein [Campylobacter sp.]
MRKVGLITFHNALNYGAALQAYATQKYINQLGYDCEIIDYINDTRAKSYDMKFQISQELKNRNIKMAIKMFFGAIFMNARRKSFQDFYAKHTKKTSKTYKTPEEIKAINDDFDFFVAGSDQVWNPKNNGKDSSYLLGFVKDSKKKISYASSFGVSKIPQDLLQVYKECLLSINSLSTREQIGVSIIKELTQKDSELVLDPVFLLSKEQWIHLATNQKKSTKKIFVYTNKKNQYEELISSTKLNINGYKVHKISRFLGLKDFIDPDVKIDYSITPQQFLSNILNSDLVITASFHCVAFSIILQKRFIAILTGDEGRDERIKNLLKITGLETRIYNKNMTEKDIYEDIDYDKVQQKLQTHIKKSKEFLKKSLNEDTK